MNKYVGFGLEVPILSREDWGARFPLTTYCPPKLTTPVSYVRLTHTGTPQCGGQDCAAAVRELQEYHMEVHLLTDIAYNFLVGGDGVVYKGRGWYIEPDRPKKYAWLTGQAVDIAFIGNFKTESPSWRMLEAAVELIKYAVNTWHIQPTFKVIPYKDIEPPKTNYVDR